MGGKRQQSEREKLMQEQSYKRSRHTRRSSYPPAPNSRQLDTRPPAPARNQHRVRHQFDPERDRRYMPRHEGGNENEYGNEHMSNDYNRHDPEAMHAPPGPANAGRKEGTHELGSSPRRLRSRRSLIAPPEQTSRNATEAVARGSVIPSTRSNGYASVALPQLRSRPLRAPFRTGRDNDEGSRETQSLPKTVPSPTLQALPGEEKQAQHENHNSPPRRARTRDVPDNTNDAVSNDRGPAVAADYVPPPNPENEPVPMFDPNNFAKTKGETLRAKQENCEPLTENSVTETPVNNQTPTATTATTEMCGATPSRTMDPNYVEEEILSEGDGAEVDNLDLSIDRKKKNESGTESDVVEVVAESGTGSTQGGKQIRTRNVNQSQTRGLGGTSTIVKRRHPQSVHGEVEREETQDLHVSSIFKARPEVRKLPSNPDLEVDVTAIKDVFEHFLASQMGIVALSVLGLTTKIVSSEVSTECNNLDFIEQLQLNDNFIDIIPDELRATLERGTSFEMNLNYINRLPHWFYDACAKRMRILCLERNNISELPDGIEKLTQLETLNVSYNQIESLPSGLAELEKLRYINVAGNKLTKLPDNMGFSNKSLLSVDISHNYDYATGIPQTFETCLYNMEHFFFTQTKLYESKTRKAWNLPIRDLLLKLISITDEQISNGWARKLELLQKSQRKRAQ